MKYWLAPNISYKTFKLILSKFPESSPTPKNIDLILWQLLRDRQLNIYLDSKDREDPVQITQGNIKGGKVIEPK